MKLTICLAAALIAALFLGAVPAFAETDAPLDNENIILFWDNADSVILDIRFSGNTATCSAMIEGKSNMSSIKADFALKRADANGLTTLKTWTGRSSSTGVLDFSETYSAATKGETYVFEVTATVTAGGTTEKISDYVQKNY